MFNETSFRKLEPGEDGSGLEPDAAESCWLMVLPQGSGTVCRDRRVLCLSTLVSSFLSGSPYPSIGCESVYPPVPLPTTYLLTHHPSPTHPSTTSSTHYPYLHSYLPINQFIHHLPIYSSVCPSSYPSVYQFISCISIIGSFCLPNPRPSPRVMVKASIQVLSSRNTSWSLADMRRKPEAKIELNHVRFPFSLAAVVGKVLHSGAYFPSVKWAAFYTLYCGDKIPGTW